MAGCTNLNPQLSNLGIATQKTVDPTLTTPGVVRVMPEMSSVGLEWTPTIDTKVVGYRVYRTTDANQSTLVGKLDNRYNSHFSDSKLKAFTHYSYAVASIDAQGAESNRSNVEVTTLPLPPSVSFIQAVSGLVKQVKIIWRPHDYPSVIGYDVYRNDPKNTSEWTKIATLKGRLNVEYIDRGLEDARTYTYRVTTLFPDDLQTTFSESVKGSTKVPPMVPTNLKATNDQPKKIILSWDGVVGATSYRIYRTGSAFENLKEPLKTQNTTYADEIKQDGKSYSYQVSALDVEDLEGGKTPLNVQGTTLPVPATPLIQSSAMVDGKVTLQWSVVDNRAVAYQVRKRKFTGPFKSKIMWEEKNYRGITEKTFVDSELVPGERYDYKIEAIDQFGLISTPSEPVEIDLTQMTPKG